MTNYEWIQTLEIDELATILSDSHSVLNSWIGDSREIFKKWLNSERSECLVSDCIWRYSQKCDVCWCRCRYEG